MGSGCCVSSQGPVVLVDQEYGDEVVEAFREQTGGQSQTGQLDIIETLTRGDGQKFVPGTKLNGRTHTHTHTHTPWYLYRPCSHSGHLPLTWSPDARRLTVSWTHAVHFCLFNVVLCCLSPFYFINTLRTHTLWWSGICVCGMIHTSSCGSSCVSSDCSCPPGAAALSSLKFIQNICKDLDWRREQTMPCELKLKSRRPAGRSSVFVVNVCVLLSAQCQLEADAGTHCADYVQAWFFDKDIGACSPFWYGGCGGNTNRFNTENECFRTCGSHSKSWLHIWPQTSRVSHTSVHLSTLSLWLTSVHVHV